MNGRVEKGKQINAKYADIWKNIIQKRIKKYEYKVEEISFYTDEEIQKEKENHEKDIENAQKIFEIGNSIDKDIFKDIEKYSKVNKNCEKDIQNAYWTYKR